MKKKISMKSASVQAKIILYSAMMFLFIFLVAISGVVTLNMTNQAHKDRYNNYAQGQLELSEAACCFKEISLSLRNIVFIHTADEEKQQESQQHLMDKIAEVEGIMFSDFSEKLELYDSNIAEDFNQCVAYCLEYKDVIEKCISYVNSGNLEAAQLEILTKGVTAENNVEATLEAIIADLEVESEVAGETVEAQIPMQKMFVLGFCIFCMIISGFYCRGILKSIVVPIGKLSKASKKLAVGDADVDCEKTFNDELGELLDSFGEMAEAIRQQAKIAEVISNGDLNVEVKPRGENDILGKALKKMVEDNNRTLGNIKESTMKMTIGAEQVATVSQALAQGSTEQASALEQVSASMDEISERTKVNASEASEANELINSVKEMAVVGNGQMKSMIHAMNEINESSETISKIIKMIDDIAFQTNILALNAAVEAARAGEHGKGFAVVAEEVRNLAAKSASAASETAEMIDDSIHKVNNGTKLAEDTAQSLNEIVESIDKIVALINSIAIASKDQATVVNQIDQAIGQVSSVVQTNSATSEQCAAASEELSNHAATLRRLVANYKLSNENKSNSVKEREKNTSLNEQIISLDGDF